LDHLDHFNQHFGHLDR